VTVDVVEPSVTQLCSISYDPNIFYHEMAVPFYPPTEERVVTPAGVTVAAFAVKPDHTVEVRADFSGMYVVHTLDGRYIKKLSVRK
jgi:hypothetical protein